MKNDFFDSVQNWTESILTKKKAKRLARKKKRTVKGEVLDWLRAIVFAVVVVFLINQYLFQFFVIPSPSMLETLQIGDRVSVSKVTYGIEVWPEGPKIQSGRMPERDDVITFYNPEYEKRGILFNILNRVLYMSTFSLVNIDRNKDGSIRESLLVKRVAALPGETVTFRRGQAYIRLAGTFIYENEADFRISNGYTDAPHRTIDESIYDGYAASGILEGMYEKGVGYSSLPGYLLEMNKGIDSTAFYTDYYEYSKNIYKGRLTVDPSDFDALSAYTRMRIGIYVPQGHVLPLGDNRDNSSDGRYFGPVPISSVTGHANIRIWPLKGFGGLEN